MKTAGSSANKYFCLPIAVSEPELYGLYAETKQLASTIEMTRNPALATTTLKGIEVTEGRTPKDLVLFLGDGQHTLDYHKTTHHRRGDTTYLTFYGTNPLMSFDLIHRGENEVWWVRPHLRKNLQGQLPHAEVLRLVDAKVPDARNAQFSRLLDQPVIHDSHAATTAIESLLATLAKAKTHKKQFEAIDVIAGISAFGYNSPMPYLGSVHAALAVKNGGSSYISRELSIHTSIPIGDHELTKRYSYLQTGSLAYKSLRHAVYLRVSGNTVSPTVLESYAKADLEDAGIHVVERLVKALNMVREEPDQYNLAA